ncbi:MAG: hypothetical protein WC378_11045 [Opitutaceae bacterium]|jgi:hypothetical protein
MIRHGKWFARNRGGVLFKTLLFLLVLFALCSLAWMMFLPFVVAHAIGSRTGFEVKVESLYANPFTAKVHIKGLTIRNPDDFPNRDFVDLRELRADADLFSLFGDRIVIDEAVVNVAQVALVKNKEGLSNATLFKQRLVGEAPEATPPGQPEPRALSPGKQKEFLIRKLELRLDRLLLVEGASPKPTVAELNLNFSQSYENVTSPVQIAVPIVEKATALGGTLGDFAGKLGPRALEAAKMTAGKLKELGHKTGETLKSIFQSIKDKAGK